MVKYALMDPNTNEVKYVGEIDNIDGWYDKHKNDDWVKRLRKIYKKPVMNIIGDIREVDIYVPDHREVKLNPPPVEDIVKLNTTPIEDIVKLNPPPVEDIVKVIPPPVEDIVKLNTTPKNGDIVDIYVPDHREVKRNHTEEHRIKLSNALGHKVIINGVEYRSKLHAKKELKVSYNTVIKLME